MLPLAQPASVTASAQDRPPKGKIRLFVAANTERAVPGQVSRQVDVDESANELRKRAKGLDWVQLVDRQDDADLVVTLTGRRKDPNRGFVLSYILEAGAHKVEEFASEGGTEITVAPGAGRWPDQLRRTAPRSWEELASSSPGRWRASRRPTTIGFSVSANDSSRMVARAEREHQRMRSISLRVPPLLCFWIGMPFRIGPWKYWRFLMSI
jgi:hypothetical protein